MDWTGGLTLKIIFTPSNKTYSPVELWKTLQPSLYTYSQAAVVRLHTQQCNRFSLHLLVCRKPDKFLGLQVRLGIVNFSAVITP